MAAFAIAEQMRAEREHRRQAQTELRNTYDVTPIGLFTLDSAGHFVRANPALRPELVYAWADETTLLRRYTETRRRHPLAPPALLP